MMIARILSFDVQTHSLKILTLANTDDNSCELVGCMAEGAKLFKSATVDSGDCVWLEPVVANGCTWRYLDKILQRLRLKL